MDYIFEYLKCSDQSSFKYNVTGHRFFGELRKSMSKPPWEQNYVRTSNNKNTRQLYMSITKNTPHILKHSGLSFTTILNNTANSIKDAAALGIYFDLASKPSDWIISETYLQNRFDMGRDAVRSKMAKLKLLGLIRTSPIKNSKGQIVRWETTLYSEVQLTETKDTSEENHITENPSSGGKLLRNDASCQNHITENPVTGKSRRLENPPTTNKRSKQIKDLNKPPISPRGGSKRFEEFWNLYPKRKAKDYCETKWRQKSLDEIADTIIEKLKMQVSQDEEWSRGYAPNPSTYINQARWKDEITNPRPMHARSSLSPIYDDSDTSWIEDMAL